MEIKPFLLERHFAKYEFEVPYQLSCSDCEPLGLTELLAMASPGSVRLWENLQLSYTESQGHTLLREEISKMYEGIDPADVIVCVPGEGIFLVMNALLKAGDHLVVISPCYQSLGEVAASAGCRVSAWEADGNGRYQTETLRALVTVKTRMVVINFPHNPSGEHINTDQLKEISDFCEAGGLILFSDEMYRGLERDETHRLPCAAALSSKNIALSGMSKSFALPGLRIGWLVCRDAGFRKWLMTLKDYTTICSSAPSEILAVIALQNREMILSRNIAIINRNIALVDEFSARNSSMVFWKAPQAGSVALLDLLSGQTSGDACRELLERKSMLAIGLHLFGSRRSAIRLGLGRTSFPAALDRVEEWISDSRRKG